MPVRVMPNRTAETSKKSPTFPSEGIVSMGTSFARSTIENRTRRIAGLAVQLLSRYAGISDARTGPNFTENPPQAFCSFDAETPDALSCGRMSVRCEIIDVRLHAESCLTISLVQNVPFPAAHQTLMPFVSSTRIQAFLQI